VANTYLLVMREIRENNGAKAKLDIGDIIDYQAELPDGSAPWFGRVPLMSSPVDGHDYGGVHSIIKVIGLDVSQADQYVHPQLGLTPRLNDLINYNPNARQRSWHLDMAKIPANHKSRLEGVKPMPFTDKFDDSQGPGKGKHKLGVDIADDTMTLVEFESWMTFKPVIPAL